METTVIVACGIALLLIAYRAMQRTHTSTDFFLAGRKLPSLLAALSQFANAGLIWALLVLPIQAYDLGAAAVWQAGALLLGYLLSWHFLAPRLQRLSIDQHSITLGQLIAADFSQRSQRVVMVSLALIVSCAVLLMTSARWTLAMTVLEPSDAPVLIASAAAVAAYLMLGGYWAASMVDTVFAGLTVLLLLILAIATGLAAGGQAVSIAMPAVEDWFAGHAQIVGLSFAVGLIAAGLGDAGQPQALNRFMAVTDAAALRRARGPAFAVMICAVVCALSIGWFARSVPNMGGDVLWIQAVADRVLPQRALAPVIGILAGWLVLSVGSAWLAAVAGWIVDLRHQRSAAPTPLWAVRWLVLLFALAAVAVGFLSANASTALERFQLGWQILAASVGPWLLARLCGKRIRATATIGAIWAGFLLTLIFHVMPASAGDYLERVLPFIAALGFVLTGGERRRDPDRADTPFVSIDESRP